MRLDLRLVEAGLVRSRHQAQAAIAAGRVRVNGRLATKSAQVLASSDRFTLTNEPWVSRGAHKLLGALDDLEIQVPERCLDAGASTGGFTQVLLSRGAKHVYAVDVGHGQLAPEIAGDARVTALEGRHVNDLSLTDLDGLPVGLAVADLSFISLTLVLARLLSCVSPDGSALLLVKPQFEVGRGAVPSSGVVRDEQARRSAVDSVARAGADLGWKESWRGESHLPGTRGNIEYFLWLQPV